MPNHKRVFRIMKRRGPQLQRHTGCRKGRLHDGKVVVVGLRGCSDVFEINCWNGEIVRIDFVIEAMTEKWLAWHRWPAPASAD